MSQHAINAMSLQNVLNGSLSEAQHLATTLGQKSGRVERQSLFPRVLSHHERHGETPLRTVKAVF